MNSPADDIGQLLVESANGFLAEHYESRHPCFEIESPQPVNRLLWSKMAELGWLGLALPENLGGSGLGVSEAALLAEAMGRQAAAEPLIAAAIIPALVLSCCEATPRAEQLANALGSGESLVTLAWQENAGELTPTLPATQLTGETLTGAKQFVPVVEDDTLMLVTARDGDELVILSVNTSAQGVAYQRKAGGAFATAQVSFNNTPIAIDDVLLRGQTAREALQSALEAARVVVAAQLAGLAAGALDKTVDYVNERVQFNRPIGSFQAVQHRCVDASVANMMAGACWRNAQKAFNANPSANSTAVAISAAKARCGDAALQACKTGVQLHGAMGFTEEGGMGNYLRAAMQLANWLGNPTAHRRRFLSLQQEAQS